MMLDSRGRAKTCCSSWLLSTMPASWSISRVVKALISLQGPMAMFRWGGGCFRQSVFLLGLLPGCSDGQWTVRVALYIIHVEKWRKPTWLELFWFSKGKWIIHSWGKKQPLITLITSAWEIIVPSIFCFFEWASSLIPVFPLSGPYWSPLRDWHHWHHWPWVPYDWPPTLRWPFQGHSTRPRQ